MLNVKQWAVGGGGFFLFFIVIFFNNIILFADCSRLCNGRQLLPMDGVGWKQLFGGSGVEGLAGLQLVFNNLNLMS